MSFTSNEPDAAARMAEIIGQVMGRPEQHDRHLHNYRLELRKRRDLASLEAMRIDIANGLYGGRHAVQR